MVLILFGWTLGVLTNFISWLWKVRVENRRIGTRLKRIIDELFIRMQLKKEFAGGGVVQQTENLSDSPTIWRTRFLEHPPSLPADFDKVLDQLSDWEARRGRSRFTNDLLNIKDLTEEAGRIYSSIDSDIKNQETITISDRDAVVYNELLNTLESALHKFPVIRT